MPKSAIRNLRMSCMHACMHGHIPELTVLLPQAINLKQAVC